MRRWRWRCVAAVWMLSAGCVFGSRPILPGAASDAGLDRAMDSGNGVAFGDVGSVPAPSDTGAVFSDAGGTEVHDNAACVPRDGGAGDGGDGGWVLRDGGDPCDPAINVRDGGAGDAATDAGDAATDAGDAGDAATDAAGASTDHVEGGG
jgi:hypothetical protein